MAVLSAFISYELDPCTKSKNICHNAVRRGAVPISAQERKKKCSSFVPLRGLRGEKVFLFRLVRVRLRKSYISVGGGNRSQVSASIDDGFFDLGWRETKFDTRIVVDDSEIHSPTHQVDNYKNKIAVEVEWNNKDPFFDRDLNNFRLLFDLRVISVGIIITRTDALQNIFNSLGRGSSYGEATTHMRKLLPKVEGGGGGGCPVLVFGIKPSLYLEDD